MDYRPPYLTPGSSSYYASPVGTSFNNPQSRNSNNSSLNLPGPSRISAGPSTLDKLLQTSADNARGYHGQWPERSPSVPEMGRKAEENTKQGSGGGMQKRGSKACAACRRGKNRCELGSGASQPCKRCEANGLACVFEKPSDKSSTSARNTSAGGVEETTDNDGRVHRLEQTVADLAQGQQAIHGALNRLISMLPNSGALIPNDGAVSTASIFNNSVSPPSAFAVYPPISPQNHASGRASGSNSQHPPMQQFPKLPGFKPPNHEFGTYGIIPLSSAPGSPTHSRHSRSSSSHSAGSNGALPQGSLTAPIQALEALADAAKHAAGLAAGDEGNVDSLLGNEYNGDRGRSRKRKHVTIDDKHIHLRVRKKTKPDPTPRNPFPDVVTKNLVSEMEARELWDLFFSGCHYFVPLWDKTYDLYETYIERTPFSTNGLLAVAAKIRDGNGRLSQTFHACLEEAQGIARSTLFGPIVRKEAAMAMLILSLWSQNGWLPCGHALRMALDMNLHRALDKMADGTDTRTEIEERDLVVSARIWLNAYLHDHLVSLGNGKPMLLRDESSVKHARMLITHRMASETDIRLVASVELVNLRVRVVEHLNPLHGKIDTQTISFVRRIFADLQEWHRGWLSAHRQRYDETHVLVKLLEAEMVHAQLWTVCVALRGAQWDSLAGDSRELAFQAKDAAQRCLEIYLRSQNFRRHLKFATHEQLVSVAFAAIFLLKMALLFPQSVSMPTLIKEVSEVSHMLANECFAERYALTLRLMLSSLRRKTGAMSTVPGSPRYTSGQNGEQLPFDPNAFETEGLNSLLSLPQAGTEGNEIGNLNVENWNFDQELENFSWPTEFSPSNLPTWLQDGNFADLGLPPDGSDSLFLPPELANMFLPSGSYGAGQFSLPDSGDVGAEAW